MEKLNRDLLKKFYGYHSEKNIDMENYYSQNINYDEKTDY